MKKSKENKETMGKKEEKRKMYRRRMNETSEGGKRCKRYRKMRHARK